MIVDLHGASPSSPPLLPEIPCRVRDRTHELEVTRVRPEGMVGHVIHATIYTRKAGTRSRSGRSFAVPESKWAFWARKPAPRVEDLAPPTTAQLDQAKRSGELHAMPGQIKD